MFDDFFKASVLFDEFKGTFRAYALDWLEIVAAEKNTQVDKL